MRSARSRVIFGTRYRSSGEEGDVGEAGIVGVEKGPAANTSERDFWYGVPAGAPPPLTAPSAPAPVPARANSSLSPPSAPMTPVASVGRKIVVPFPCV